jgi:glycosyltransferase involved in cell wall biosynthesis
MSKKSLKQTYDIFWGYRLLRDAAKLIALTPMEAQQFERWGVSRDRIEIIPNGINLAEFKNLPRQGEFKKKWSIDDSQKVILSLSRIHEIKGLDLLVKAFAELSKEINNAKLIIAGPDDGYLSILKKLIKELRIEEKVILTGLLRERGKLAAYIDAEVYVLPSSYEIFGRTILEAMACGTPVVITDRCGIAPVICGQTGLVVSYDQEQLRNALVSMLSDDEMRTQFSKKGKLLVRKEFDLDKIIEQIENIYEDCMSSKQ